MKIWLLEDGKRTGPFESFTLRERIANGEFGPETPAWYDGADGWVTLADVPTMVSAFPKVEEKIIEQYQDIRNTSKTPEDDLYKHEIDVPEQLAHPPKLHPVQRFFARMIDVFIYLMLVSYVKLEQGIDLYEPLAPTQQFLYHVPYILVDAAMMHLFGTTIGKYFLRIKVQTATGTKLGLGASLLRSARVWVVGLGMFTMIMPLSFLFSWFISRRFGKFLWDLPKNIHVEVKPLQPMKVVLVVAIVWSLSYLLYQRIPEEMRPKGTISEQWEEMKRKQRQE